MDSTESTAKRGLLSKQGVLHPHPSAVTAPVFHNSDFFDPHDLVQVKYEMLRCVEVEQTTASQAARQAGMSRPAFYQAQAGFTQGGMAGLIPQKPGPRRAHKLTPAVRAWLERKHSGEPELAFSQLAELAQQELAVQLHPRTIERALSRRQKKLR